MMIEAFVKCVESAFSLTMRRSRVREGLGTDMGKVAVFTAMSTLLIAGALAAVLSYANPMSNEGIETLAKDHTTTHGFLSDGVPPLTEWNKTYGGTGWDVANSVIETSDEDYMLAGYTDSYGAGGGDFWLVKTNSAGRMLWNRTYGGQEYDEAQSIIQTVDGGYALAGVTRSYGLGVTDFWLVKTDSNGNHQWNRTYGGAGYDYLFSAIRTGDNGFALVGYTESYGQGGDFWLVKTDSNGIMEWNKIYGGDGREEAHSIVQTGDGGYAIVGETDSTGAGGTDIWWVKTALDGKKQRGETYGGVSADGAYSLVQTSDGGYAIAGFTYSYGVGAPDYSNFWLVKIDSSGRQLWDQPFGGLGADSAESLVGIEGGGFALAGSTQLYNVSDPDFWLVTTDSAGNLNWSQTYGGAGYDYPYSVTETSDRGFGLVGYTFSYGLGSGDMWLVKVEGSIPRHDVAVIGVTPSKTVVGQGYSLSVTVTVENQGNRLETFNVTVYANTVIVDTLANMQTIMSGSIRTLVFIWDTSEGEFPKGSYTIKAEAMIASPTVDADPADNSHANGVVNVSYPGDVDANGKVDAFDVFELGRAYASHLGDSNWDANCDIDSSGTVDALDLSLINETYGKSS